MCITDLDGISVFVLTILSSIIHLTHAYQVVQRILTRTQPQEAVSLNAMEVIILLATHVQLHVLITLNTQHKHNPTTNA